MNDEMTPKRGIDTAKQSVSADPISPDGATNGRTALHEVALNPDSSAAHAIAELRHDPAAIRHLFESGEYPYKSMMRTAPYEAHMLELQRELLKAQRWVEKTGQRIIILFEGRDAAGKGGTIKRFMEHMNPAPLVSLLFRNQLNESAPSGISSVMSPISQRLGRL